MTFKDHFSGHAQEYARYRPTYPDEMFAFLAGLTRANEKAWDCATGNGQAAVLLTQHYAQVVATDASAEQIGNATGHKKISYSVARAEDSGLNPHTCDLITVGQALHWFDRPSFFLECSRVLKPGGVLAAWCYNLLRIDPAIDEILNEFYHETVGPYWPAERTLLEKQYDTIQFPFVVESGVPQFQMTGEWDLPHLLGYLNTWSATRNYIEANGTNPVDEIAGKLAGQWGMPQETKLVEWPLYLKISRIRP